MKRRTRWLCWLPLTLGCAGAPSPNASLAADGVSACQPGQTATASLEWLVGCWQGQQGGALTSERWRLAADGWLLGDNRTVKNGTVVHEERMRIQHDPQGWRYHASPQGQAAAVFPIATRGHHCVDFEELSHDFPQRIGYRRGGHHQMTAFIAGQYDGEHKHVVWKWRRVACTDVRDD